MTSAVKADDWRPAADRAALEARARLLARIRAFFSERGVLEVETPLLGRASATDLHIASIEAYPSAAGSESRLYLQTSPEFAMKRLLAAGSGPIFQICKAFRDEPPGRMHNPEFTMLEWYRPGFDHHALMDEVEALMCPLLGLGRAVRLSYDSALRDYAGITPFSCELEALRERARALGLSVESAAASDRDACLNLIFSHAVQPNLGTGLVFVYDYPASQASLARIRLGKPAVAERFEAFADSVELANGYHELTDAAEQRRRFELDLAARQRLNVTPVAIDEHLIAALDAGLPACAGVAVGLDRLLMAMTGAGDLCEVLAFPVERA